MATTAYHTEETISKNSVKHFFISEGYKTIIKVVAFDEVGTMHNKRVFNLGFGDYDVVNDTVDDSSNSDNGDTYKVFHTVLNTIPKFFQTFSEGIIMVEGSDSTPEFVENCKLTCRKRCGDASVCKNQNRRINVYRNYVNKNYDDLKVLYSFFGGSKDKNLIEPYVPEEKYDSVFVIKNN